MKVILTLICIGLMVALCSRMQPVNAKAISLEVLEELQRSEKAWNEGSLEGYMAIYEKSDSLRFAGNSSYTMGWQPALERYRHGYPDRETMGTLTFSGLKIKVISGDAALVFGHWELARSSDHPDGLFTLLFRKTGAGWKIVHDHSSGNPPSD